MKKQIVVTMTLLVSLFSLVYSCMDERIEPVDEAKLRLIEDAKRMFYQSTPEEGLIELRSTSEAGGMPVKPMWEYASTHESKKSQVVEIPLTSEYYFGFATPGSECQVQGDGRSSLPPV